MRFLIHALVMVLVLAVALPAAAQQQDFSQVEVKAEKVAEGLYMLTGRGGNIGLSVGKSGSFLVDDQYAPLSDKILAAVKAITPDPVRFVVNTHWHGDHTGGNENMGKTGAPKASPSTGTGRRSASTTCRPPTPTATRSSTS